MSLPRMPSEVRELVNAFLQTCGANPNNVLESPWPRIDWDRRTLITTELDYDENGKWHNPATEEVLTKQVEYPIPNNTKRGHT